MRPSGRRSTRSSTAHRLREIEKRQRNLAAGARDTDLLGLLGIIGRWWVVGPFDLGEKNEGWATSYIGEPNVNVVARYMAGKTRRQWKRVESQDPHGKIDLRATIADRDNCIGYAYAEIELPRPADAVLLLGVDDSEKIWVNGSQGLRAVHGPRARGRPGSRAGSSQGGNEHNLARAREFVRKDRRNSQDRVDIFLVDRAPG